VDSWTRTNAASPNPVRVFNGDTVSDFAWSLGAGVAWQVSRPGRHPVIIEATWRYYDFGTAEGGTVADVGVGTPRQPLTFENRDHVFSIGVRIPLQRL
jgi:opacity protein-like surface antigen